MSELGQLLSEARAAKEWGLADVEAATRIRQKYLLALENGAYAELPRGATARGFVRTYAAHLGLDVDQALRLYAEESGDTGDEAGLAEADKPRATDYRPLEVELIGSGVTLDWSWLRWIVAAAAVIGLVVIGWFLLCRYAASLRPWAALAPQPTATVTQTTETATPWVVTATPEPTRAAPAVLPTPTSDLLTLPTPTVLPTPVPTRPPTSTPEVVASIDMTISTTQRSWVRAIVDGATVQEGILNAGDIQSYQANESITIRTGNAGGVYLVLNGEDLGPMGEVGQVVERTWVVEQGGVSETEPRPAAPSPTAVNTATPAG